MQLIHIKPAPTRKKKGRKANQQEVFEKYWRLVEKSQKDNARLAEDIAGLRQRYEAEILPTEQELNELMAQECFHLMHFLASKGLSDPIRVVLLEWLTSNVEALESHPYYPAEEKEKIVNAMLDCLQRQLPGSAKGQSRGKRPANVAADSTQPNLFGDEELNELDELQQQAGKEQAFRELEGIMKETLSEDAWQEFKRMFDPAEEMVNGDANHQYQQPGTRPGEDLVRPESINLLFRRLAKVLHPDKEPDAARKAEKHQLMSQLLKAREHNDLPALLALHRQYVADEPLAVDEDELRGLIAMLKSQLDQLAADQQQLISTDQVNFAVYHWYYGKTPKQVTSNIKRHLQGLGGAIGECRHFIEQVKTASQLRRFLQARGMA